MFHDMCSKRKIVYGQVLQTEAQIAMIKFATSVIGMFFNYIKDHLIKIRKDAMRPDFMPYWSLADFILTGNYFSLP